MDVFCRIEKRRQATTALDDRSDRRCWRLSNNSVDRYGVDIFSLLVPPFGIELVRAGPRVGWRWTNGQRRGCCEINWYDEEPMEGSDEYDDYRKVLTTFSGDIWPFRGFSMLPTEEEYQRFTTHW